MAHPSIAHLSIPKAALLLGFGPAWAWRLAHQGKFGALLRRNPGRGAKRGVVLISIAELEKRSGQTFTREQIEKAAANPARSKFWKAKTTIVRTTPDKAVIEREIATRDAEWRHWLSDPRQQVAHPMGPLTHFRGFGP